VQSVQRKKRKIREEKHGKTTLLACSAEKVLDWNRRNLVQLCLLLGGDRVQGKEDVGTGINSNNCDTKAELEKKKIQDKPFTRFLVILALLTYFPSSCYFKLPMQQPSFARVPCILQKPEGIWMRTGKALLTFFIFVFLTVKRRTV